jgi:hypothetical protein
METTKKDVVAEMLAQYEKNSKNSYTKKENAVAYDEKHYFGTFLEAKENEAQKTIRIIPTEDGSTPLVEMIGHKIQVEGQWKTFACLKAEKDTDCPFCEARQVLLATGNESDKKLANGYGQKKMYIVKVIDRDHEEDGPKFWRFNHDYRKQGIFDKIIGVMRVARDITSAEKGRDLSVSIARDQNKRPFVQQIAAFDPSPLSADPAQAQEWINDPMTWQDVYSIKPYDYLEIIVKGGVPYWDKEQSKFVDKKATKEIKSDNLDAELSIGVANVKPNIQAASQPIYTPTISQEEIDDLPF